MSKRIKHVLALLSVAVVVAACGGNGQSGNDAAGGPPKRGGTLTLLERNDFAGAWPSGLDPATNTTGGANMTQMNAIFGGLFVLAGNDDGSNIHVQPDLASGYDLSPDGKTLKITIRDGVKFSDGTPFDAEAVAFNFKRDVSSSCTCAPKWPLVADNPITTEGNTVVVKFTRANAAVINGFTVSNVNWIASPTALQKMGPDQFKIAPVGAGPFVVDHDVLSTELDLSRNPNYFKPGQPYLDKLIIKAIGGDQPAYQAIQAGQGQAYESMQTTPLVEQAKANKNLQVTESLPTSPYVIQLNTKIAPFDNQRAREAIYYATNADAINKGLFKGNYAVTQSFTAPGGLFYSPSVPGYRTFDLEKAKSIVQELGGLTVDLGLLKSYVAEQVGTALQSQWQAAGIKVTMHSDQLSGTIQNFNSGKWQSMLQTAGSWDPAAGTGVSFRFASGVPYSGVADPALDNLLNQAAGDLDQAKRKSLYDQAAKLISDKAYAPFMFTITPANVVVKGVHGTGLTTKLAPVTGVNPTILWDTVWMSQ
ncbi:ABC transporter substrate-binding protein [Amycolatopsis pigmentata]|uniref:ABC transporter substrate-binding protein n=1 Tax=Amycolatopsis pigmentata TaxID=450801 RepID=A0ABW5G9A5_9PSEU